MGRSDRFKEKSGKYKPTNKNFRKKGEKTHGKGRHKAKKVGGRISFKTPRGRKSGTVKEVHKEYYIVQCKNGVYKVNRKSILYSMGFWAGKVIGAPKRTASRIKKKAKKIKKSFGESYKEGKAGVGRKERTHKKKKKKKKEKPGSWR